MKNKLDICRSTRKITADSLLKTLQKVLHSTDPISEADFRDLWLAELRTSSDIFPDGWYIPPPHGIGVLFSTEENIQRMNYKSLRPKENWPQKNVFLDKHKGIAYLFTSPVDKETHIIGDFGITIYFGKNKKFIDHLITSYRITQQIFSFAQLGMKFSDIAKYSSKLCKENNLINLITSSTDPVGTNIGHTVPTTDIEWSNEDKNILKSGSWEKICKLISNKRVFVNEVEEATITKEMAITIEPRPRNINDPSIPMVSFHTIGLFHQNGEKELLTNFDEIFKLVGMEYMLK